MSQENEACGCGTACEPEAAGSTVSSKVAPPTRPAAQPTLTTSPADIAIDFKIHGMDCAEEVGVLRRALNPLVPEESLEFDPLNGRMRVRADVPAADIIRAVSATGMRAEPWVEPKSTVPEAAHPWGLRDTLAAASGIGTALGFGLHVALAGVSAAIGSEGAGLAEAVPWSARAAYAVAIGAGLWIVLPKAWYAARTLRPDMNLLMAIAVAGALSLGEWFEAATVSFLFALSLALEAWSVGRARRSVAALLRLAPERARIVQEGVEVEVEPAAVSPGTVVYVRPGERFPLDGRVHAGRSEVNQAPITGESVPVSKQAGDEVFAGTINGGGALEIVSTKAASDTTLARIVRMVADSQAKRSESEQWVDRFARVYTPVVLALAIAVALVPPLLLGGAWDVWIYRALVLLVIGCPCALVIATPVSIVAALAAAASHGVLLKGGRLVEIPASLKVLAVDKTGTLTEGRPRVVEVVPLNGHDERSLLARAAAVEARSEHPIAMAVLDHARSLGITPVAASDVRSVAGRGAEGTIEGRTFWLGSHRWLEERGQETPEVHARLVAMSSAGCTVVVVGNDDHVCGLLGVADAVRPDAAAAVAALKREIGHIVVLTGDNRGTAEAVARAVGIEDVRAELLPADKVREVEALERQYGAIAMVGDGVNDAPALARASFGIAMGVAGTDVAIETADVALMGDDLRKIAWLVRHSRRTLRVIRANAAFALGIKALFVVLTFAGVASLWGAIAADMGASLLVVFNALRLLRSPEAGIGRHEDGTLVSRDVQGAR
ncbi:MAG: heavy metal translocating P-type ATPase [Sandaracinaceae bacterium]|nr:heavy metal translocating P-type ATPase [Sandaracinaceae bacterium]